MIHPIDRSRAIDRFEQIPRLALGHYPTPLEKLARLRETIGGGPKLYIKRDDYTGPGGGGNKVRKLEYILSEAQSKGADTVITCGGVRSNHCRATAMMAAKLGLKCVLVLNASQAPAAKPASLAIDEWVGARVVLVANRDERTAAMERLAAEIAADGGSPFVIPVGASTALGAMGYVAAASELAAQMAARELRFDAIFFSSSSGGTHAGLAAGRALFLPPETRLIGVSPDDSSAAIANTVRGIVGGIGERLGADIEGQIEVLDDYIGAGYGIESEAGRRAFELAARAEGVLLDPVYTAKAMAALLDWIAKGRFTSNDRVLFWHTGGQMALFHREESS